MKHIKLIHIKQESEKKIIFTEGGKYIVFFHNVSGNFIFDINASGVDLDIYGLYTGQGSDRFTVKTFQNHYFPKSRSNLLIKGIFNDKSEFGYQGLIRIEKKAQKTHAYQKNQNILLSPHVFVSSKPDLEILADDVFCTHGSTTGKLNKSEMLYLMSRGVGEKKAEKLLAKGFIEDIFIRLAGVGFKDALKCKNLIQSIYD